MEKDHFLDRTPEACILSEVHIGDEAIICEKHMQKTAETLEDLTYGTIVQILTKHDHPRGIKVKIRKMDGNVAIGRIVYLYK